MSAEKSHIEEAFSSLLLEDMKWRLLQAFRGPGPMETFTSYLPQTTADKGKGCTTVTVWEELQRAHIEGAIAWLRAELLEMKSQNCKLAKTLLDLSTEIQRLRNEADMSAGLESPTLSIAGSPK
uniref:Uncharacterized protein n=1 Tax=Salvator merianae TaxID=96440 RepID=A0A8D0E9V1_SALMN